MHNNADQWRKQMTNDKLVSESKRINRDEYSLWFEFINAEDGLVETIKKAVDDKSKSDNPLQLLESILEDYDQWKDDTKFEAESHDLSVGNDCSEALRIVREHNL